MKAIKHSVELAMCDFCRAEVPVQRKYLCRKNKEREIGDGFTITRYCQECGLEEERDTKHTDKKLFWDAELNLITAFYGGCVAGGLLTFVIISFF